MTGALFVYRWGPRWKGWDVAALPQLDRKGELCELLCRGSKNSCMVRFVSDGVLAVISRNALAVPASARQGRLL